MHTHAEANLLALIDSTEDMWGSVDLDYRMVVFNKNFERYIQSCFGVQVVAGMNPVEILPPERAAVWPQFYQRALANGSFHTEHTLQDGRIFEISVNPILMNEKPCGVSVYGRDITARKQVEQELMDSEERFRSTFEQAAIGIIHTSFEGRFLRCNKRFTEILGYSEQELVGTQYQQITHPEDQGADLQTQRELRSGEAETAILEKRYRHKDGHWVWTMLTISVQRDGQQRPLHFIAFVEDITHRKESETVVEAMNQALQSSEHRYRMAFQTCTDCFAIIRIQDGTFIDINDAFVETMGFERDEVIGHSSLELKIWENPLDREELVQILRRDFICRNFETRYRKKDGSVIWGRMSSSVIDVDGQLHHLALVRDVTEAKAAEESLIAASEAMRLTEERYRVAFETSQDPICITRMDDSVFVDVNSAFLDYLSLRREQVIGRSTMELGVWNDLEDRERLREILARDGRCRVLELQFRKLNGDRFWGLGVAESRSGGRGRGNAADRPWRPSPARAAQTAAVWEPRAGAAGTFCPDAAAGAAVGLHWDCGFTSSGSSSPPVFPRASSISRLNGISCRKDLSGWLSLRIRRMAPAMETATRSRNAPGSSRVSRKTVNSQTPQGPPVSRTWP
jgi:PAS domain S-box-containing protein